MQLFDDLDMVRIRSRADRALLYNPTSGMDANSPTGIGGTAASGGGMSAAGGAALGLGFLTTILGAYSQHKSSKVRAKMLEYNMRVAEYQAQDAIERGTIAETRRREETRRIVGAQRVSLARQGVDINEGSALAAQEEAAYLGELDALAIRNNAAREAWGYRVGATDFRAQAEYTRLGGDMAAGQTILTASSNYLLRKVALGDELNDFARSLGNERLQIVRRG